MEVPDMLAGAAILLTGLGIGGSVGFSLWRLTSDKKRKPTVCDCGHTLSAHDPKTNVCEVAIKAIKYNTSGKRIGKEWGQCACLRYVGPMPPDHFYLPQPIQDRTPEET